MRLGFLFFATLAISSANAQNCSPTWMHATGVPGVVRAGTGGFVSSLAAWDPDGIGPLAPQLVVGGSFNYAGSAWAINIATWDGQEFRGLDASFNSTVTSLAVVNGSLFAGGAGSLDGNSCVSMRDGTNWKPIAGLGGPSTANALTEFEGSLIIGGKFTSVGGKAYNNIAQWTGALQPLGAGFNNSVKALGKFKNELIALGAFTKSGTADIAHVARWDGLAWRPLGTGLAGDPLAMVEFQDALIVGGNITSAGGVSMAALARWNGQSWSALSSPASPAPSGQVNALAVREGLLIAAGSIRLEPASSPVSVAAWDGSVWRALDANVTLIDGTLATPMVLGSFGSELVLGGAFHRTARVPVMHLARWDSEHWRSLGEGTNYPGGSLLSAKGLYLLNDEKTFAKWAGDCWRSVAAPPAGFRIHRGFVHKDSIYLVGIFNDESAVRLLRFDESGFHQVGGSFDGTIVCATEFRDRLVVAGSFTRINNVDCRAVAQWDGSAWLPVGDGLWTWPHIYSQIKAIAVYHDELYVSGDFNRSGERTVRNFARSDGAIWRETPTPPQGTSSFLVNYRDRLVDVRGDNYAWDGVSWRALGGNGVYIYGAAVHFGRLIAVGDGLGPDYAQIAEWNGSDWSRIGEPITDGTSPWLGLEGRSVEAIGNTLYLSGNFGAAGSEPASCFARTFLCSLCPADLNNDALVDDADFCDFILSYNLMDCTDPAMPAGCPADFNADGLVDDTDFTRFVIDYAAFLCPEAD